MNFVLRMISEMMITKSNPNTLNWNFEHGYSNKAELNSYPLRLFSAKLDSGFRIYLDGTNAMNVCNGQHFGFKLFIHTPGEVPMISRKYYRISFNEEVHIVIKPTLITTSNGLRSYSPNQRQCFFNSERQLSFFPNLYTK